MPAAVARVSAALIEMGAYEVAVSDTIGIAHQYYNSTGGQISVNDAIQLQVAHPRSHLDKVQYYKI